MRKSASKRAATASCASRLKRAYSDGTLAVDTDPLSLLCRLATSVLPPRCHTVKSTGVLAPACPWRVRIAPTPPALAPVKDDADDDERPKRGHGTYRPWAELLMRTFGLDVLECPKCKGRMRLIAMVTEPKAITRSLLRLGELVDVPRRSPSRGLPY